MFFQTNIIKKQKDILYCVSAPMSKGLFILNTTANAAWRR